MAVVEITKEESERDRRNGKHWYEPGFYIRLPDGSLDGPYSKEKAEELDAPDGLYIPGESTKHPSSDSGLEESEQMPSVRLPNRKGHRL